MARSVHIIRRAEQAMGGLWTAGELALAALQWRETGRDPYRQLLLEDLAVRGFYPPVTSDEVRLDIGAGGRIRGSNPYRRVDEGMPGRIVGQLQRAAGAPSDRLLVVCHPYGVPSPHFMARYFGLHRLHGVDIAYNVMEHHYPGSFALWPGTTLVSARVSRFLENLRSSVTGARALIMGLNARRQYKRVSVLGYSIGGFLALHLANTSLVDRAVAYCPLVCPEQTVRELGLMRWMHHGIDQLLRTTCQDHDFSDLRLADPLRGRLQIPEPELSVIVQEHDTFTPPRHIEPIRRKYPRVGWHVFHGTHGFPGEHRRLVELVGRLVEATGTRPLALQ